MEERLKWKEVSPAVARAMEVLENQISNSGLERNLIDLINLRVSQINGCAYCIDMHSKDLRANGETEQRLYLLDAWKESTVYSERERAALEWAEALTTLNRHVPDEIYEHTRSQFSENELVNLSLATVAINGWNRLNIAFRRATGTYEPKNLRQILGTQQE